MKHCIAFFILSIGILFGSCTDEQIGEDTTNGFEEGELVEVSLNLMVNRLMTNSEAGTKAEPEEEEDTLDERAIHNIWVFQYDAVTGAQLIKPRYYVITEQAQLDNLPVLLHPNETDETSIVYIVANTKNPNWMTAQTDISTLGKLKEQELHNLEPQFINEGATLSIPMEGGCEPIFVSAKSTVTVPVTRMFAKLRVKVEIMPEYMTLRSIAINNIPKASKIKARTGNENDRTNYADGYEYWNDNSFNIKKDETPIYTLYMAENMQGKIESEVGKNDENAPDKAFKIVVQVERKDPTTQEVTQPSYSVYPGEDRINDFNIKRNCIYDIHIQIKNDTEVHIPSSNCFIVVPGNLLSFEPYYRTEKGGGFNFEDYLNPNKPDKAIARMSILWQTKDAIGDNTEGNLVYYVDAQEKIYVQTQKEGNALIAAYNLKGEIIWSWHIWITDHDPGNVTDAIRYTTYSWDEKGIYGTGSERPRTSGLHVMPCNLGAMANEPESATDTKPFGMLYQWGRKDPFPPLIKKNSSLHPYTVANMEKLYDNSNQILVNDMDDAEHYIFPSKPGSEIQGLENPIYYAVQHPTVFMCGTKKAIQGNENYVGYSDLDEYFADGDWTDDHNDELWGGLTPEDATKSLQVVSSQNVSVSIHDNYGTQKSIFDPCPKGWRVPPGDLWLGFTYNGLNPSKWDNINYRTNEGWNTDYWGLYIYMTDWRQGSVSYFPNQGTRVGNGYGIRVGSCGNYHNATADTNERVNILHIHNNPGLFHIFEYQFPMYCVKSVAGPIRCVRDANDQ